MQGDARTRAQAIVLAVNCVERLRAYGCMPPDARNEEQSGIALTWSTKPFLDAFLSDKNALVELVVQAQWKSSQGIPSTYGVATVIKGADK